MYQKRCRIGAFVLIIFGLLCPIVSYCQANGDYRSANGGSWNVPGNWERYNGGWGPVGAFGYPGQFAAVAGEVTIRIGDAIQLNVSPLNIGSVNIELGASLTTNGNVNLTIVDNLYMGWFFATSVFTFGGTGTLNVGSATINGNFTDNNNGGVTTFNDLVTVSGVGNFLTTAVSTKTNMVFKGGITNNGGFNAGGAIFNGANQSLGGNSNMVFEDDVDISGIRLTNSNSATVNFGSTGGTTTTIGTVAANHGFTDLTNTGITIFGGPLSVQANTTFGTTASATVGNLVFRGGIANAGIFTAGGATFNTNAQTITGTAALSFNNVAITGISVNHTVATNLTVNQVTTISATGGNFTDSNAAGITTFTGNVSVGAGSSFTTTTVILPANMVFSGGIASNGNSFSAGGATFNANQALTGVTTLAFANPVTVSAGIVTNNASAVTMSNVAVATLSGAGTWTQGANSTLNYAGQTLTVTAFNAGATGNTVNYNRAGAQTIRTPAANYFTLTSSVSGTKTSSGNLDVDGNLNITGTAVLDVGTPGNDITLAGNWFNSNGGTGFVEGTRLLTLDGTSAQQVTGTGGETFSNLRINNSFATIPSVIFTSNVTIAAVLTMSDGTVNLNGNNVTLSSSAAGALVHSLASSAGWFYGGSMIRNYAAGTFGAGTAQSLFPLGSAADYHPFTIQTTGAMTAGGNFTVTHAGTANNTTIVNFADPSPPPATIRRQHQSSWTVNTGAAITGVTTAFTITGGGTGFGVIANTSHIRLSKASSTVNDHLAATGTTSDPRARRSNVTLGNLAGAHYLTSTDFDNSPLPIVLKYFRANLVNDVVALKWETAQEMNNDFFTVEKTTDLETFETVLTHDGKGNSSTPEVYAATDDQPFYGRSYYRLKQTDFDGKFTYSEVQVVDFEGPQFASLKTYPNPSDGHTLFIEIAGLKDQTQVPLQVFNVQGQKVIEEIITVETPGSIKKTFTFGTPLPHGIYVVKAGPTLHLTKKIMVDGLQH